LDSIQYINELQWPGILGRLAVVVCFVAALAGSIAFFKASQRDNTHWNRISRVYFGIHCASLLGIVGLLLFVMITHRYEYQYAWNHVSDALPMRYIFSAFWEGQEGSFLLWLFWHAMLGTVLLFRNDRWVNLVMAILLAVQCIIVSMLLGIYLTDVAKIGSNPFLLLRDTMDAPLFTNPRYTELIEGNGLNPLLQNYWMTIHPPTLFLGFASVTVPFCYALSGLIRKDHIGWLKPVMPWALFSAGVLGTGVLMGGAWAYEALSFGGYWAWDPVENMSLVPWIVLIAAIHGNVVARKTGYSLRMTYAFYLLAFLLVLYSTFLTRSGILGDSSAHAFTQMGLEWQLIGFIGVFTLASAWLFFKNYKHIPTPPKEEKLSAREFWMFIGALVLFFSAVLITFTTSIPVYNKFFDLVGRIIDSDLSHLHRTAPIDAVAHYNKFQLWIAVFVALLSGSAQFLRYREPSWKTAKRKFIVHLGITALLSVGFTALLSLWIDAHAWQYRILLFCGAFAVLANLNYIIVFLRGNLKEGASAIAHLGFGLMIIGIMASGLNKQIISSNVFAQSGLSDDIDPGSHIYLIKDRPMFMNGYWVEYEHDTVKGNTREFLVSYKRINSDQDTVERFALRPNVIFNRQNTKLEATNPSTKHYLDKDIFTYVAALPAEQMDAETAKALNDTMQYTRYPLLPGDTLHDAGFEITLAGMSIEPHHDEYTHEPGDLGVQAHLVVKDLESGISHTASPIIFLRESLIYGIPAQVNDLNLRIRLSQEAITSFYPRDDQLPYSSYKMRQGETIDVGDWKIKLIAIDREAGHPHYVPQEGDIAVNAVLDISDGDTTYTARPLYYIRGNTPAHLKSYVPDAGLHIRFDNIYPQSEEFEFSIATIPERIPVPLEIAREVPRTDIIVLQAIVFPGINLFWLGSCLMMFGLFLAMWRKLKEKQSVL
ncbi:MAG TPA: cytochrome c biogenesis protein CcsA, partial [Saprospiraceae bacterium]|nr:cytochrome c biogenesis protein CcsA [Saprospiraceae bacterium]